MRQQISEKFLMNLKKHKERSGILTYQKTLEKLRKFCKDKDIKIMSKYMI